MEEETSLLIICARNKGKWHTWKGVLCVVSTSFNKKKALQKRSRHQTTTILN